MFKLVNEDSEKLQKILKFLHNTPHQGLLEGFSRLLGAHRGFKEALFSTLFLQIFFRIFQNFAPKIPEENPKIFGYPSVRAPKIRHSPSRSPRGSPNIQKISPKIFSNFWGAYMRSASKHRSERKNLQESARRILRWISRGVLRGIPRYIFGGSCGASSMNPNESCGTPFSRIFQ